MTRTLLAAVALLGLAVGPASGTCPGDTNGDGSVTIDDIIVAVNSALYGCPPTPTISLTPESTVTATPMVTLTPESMVTPTSTIALSPESTVTLTPMVTLTPELMVTPTPTVTPTTIPVGPFCGRLPASGQTTAYGPGSDGDVRAGGALSYTDNGDGTITDNNTGLMWEKKDDAGGIHDKENKYTWGQTSLMDGTMVTRFLATLNRAPCFAGYCDWRIPNVKELQSILDYEIPLFHDSAVNAAFNTNCNVEGCTVDGNGGPMCSCPTPFNWSSTTDRDLPEQAWRGAFVWMPPQVGDGLTKRTEIGVRAVRGGL